MKTRYPSLAAGDRPLIRQIHPEIRIIDEKAGIVEYIASDESLDHYQEVIRANGWKFTHFAKNAPFLDTHNSRTIENLLGQVRSWSIDKGKLVESVQWAIGLGNPVADVGWKMTVAGFLKAVSVGFYPMRYASKYDADKTAWATQLRELGMHEEQGISTVYIEQEQIELSACVLGANPNALAKAYKAGAINDEELAGVDTFVSRQIANVKTTNEADSPGAASLVRRRARLALFMEIRNVIAKA